ncbi:MAG: nitroreductase family protein [Candidatus Giovannonibacteria bacterium]|nr:MAG: nitroreductase family protein [Candidatus Giovannonibacteria bacterium]
MILDVIKSRRTQRHFSDKPVPEEYVEKILEAASWAPSSCNMQLLGLIRVTDPALRQKLVYEAKSAGEAARAPVLFVATYDKRFSQEYHSNIQSGAAAIQNMVLTAESLGLGAYWAASVGKEEIVRSIFKIPERREILALVMFGWPDKKPIPPRRRPPAEFVHNNFYDGSRDLPLSGDPDDWPIEQLKAFQEFRVWSGAKYRPYLREEFSAVLDSIKAHAPADAKEWIDFLPSTGAYLEGLVRIFPRARFKILEIADQLARFSIERIGGAGKPENPVDYANYNFAGAESRADAVSCLFRLEAYPTDLHEKILEDLSSLVKPGGMLILGVCNKFSYFLPLHRLKARRKKEIRFPVMTPQMVAPFKPVDPDWTCGILRRAGFSLEARECLFLFPTIEELTPYYSKSPPLPFSLFVKAARMFSKMMPRQVWRKYAKIQLFFLRKENDGRPSGIS